MTCDRFIHPHSSFCCLSGWCRTEIEQTISHAPPLRLNASCLAAELAGGAPRSGSTIRGMHSALMLPLRARHGTQLSWHIRGGRSSILTGVQHARRDTRNIHMAHRFSSDTMLVQAWVFCKFQASWRVTRPEILPTFAWPCFGEAKVSQCQETGGAGGEEKIGGCKWYVMTWWELGFPTFEAHEADFQSFCPWIPWLKMLQDLLTSWPSPMDASP